MNDRVCELTEAAIARLHAVVEEDGSLGALAEVIGECDRLVIVEPLIEEMVEMIRLNRQAIFADVLPRLSGPHIRDNRLSRLLRAALNLRNLPMASLVLDQDFRVVLHMNLWVPQPESPLRAEPYAQHSLEELKQFVYKHRRLAAVLTPGDSNLRVARDVPEAILMLELFRYCIQLRGEPAESARVRLYVLFVDGLGRNGDFGDAEMSAIAAYAINHDIVSSWDALQIMRSVQPVRPETVRMLEEWNEEQIKDPGRA